MKTKKSRCHINLDDFDLVMIDVWGVISDGFKLFESALEFLKHTRRMKKPVIFISNTPFRNFQLEKHLLNIGLPADGYQWIYTAGDATRRWLGSQAQNWPFKNYFYVGPNETKNLLHDLDFNLVKDVSEADFLLANGYPSETHSKMNLSQVLPFAVSKKLPLLCTNPDKNIDVEGQIFLCAGHLAHQYEELGGKVTYIGKPFPQIYRYALESFSNWVPERILAIGDSLETDIAGAQRMGFKSLWISKQLSQQRTTTIHGIEPDYIAFSLEDIV